jgi:putative FmdB family regulatory protein
MPIYEYRCQDCGNEFQKLQPMSASSEGVPCPSCESPRTDRQLSAFASASTGDSATGGAGCAHALPGGG